MNNSRVFVYKRSNKLYKIIKLYIIMETHNNILNEVRTLKNAQNKFLEQVQEIEIMCNEMDEDENVLAVERHCREMRVLLERIYTEKIDKLIKFVD